MYQVPDASALPVAVIGAGPVGLAALAHLHGRGLPAVLLEAGRGIAQSYEDFRHVRLFSPWRYNIDETAARLLEATGWTRPDPEAVPTAGEVVDRYLAPLAAHPALRARIRLDSRVSAIARRGFDRVKSAGRDGTPFALRISGPDGESELLARAVIDASGTWGQPNPLGANGLPALGESAQQGRIRYGMPDILGRERGRYAGRRVLVVGAGHSAVGSLLALAELAEAEPGTAIVWAIRGHDLTRVLGGGEADGLPARGALGLRLRALLEDGRIELRRGFRVHALVADEGGLVVHADDASLAPIAGIEEVIGATGSRPNLDMLRELRLGIDAAIESAATLAPLIDPNVHSCGTVRPHGHRELAHPEAGFYVIGAKSYGRAPTFLLATGYEQARSVVAALAGDLAAADEVRLELPETGVCSVGGADPAAACCGATAGEGAAPRPQVVAAACCGDGEGARDEDAAPPPAVRRAGCCA